MSAVLETSHESKQIKHEAGAQQVKIDPSTTLFKPWALKAMSVMRVQEAWRLKK